MTYDRPDDRDPARASASVTRTDLPQQTEFRLVASPPGTPAGGTPDGAAPDGQRAPTQPVPVVPAPAPARPAPAGPGQPAPGRSARASADSDEDPIPSGMEELQAGWQRVKAAFVDNPRGAVAEAAVLADEAAEALAAALRERRRCAVPCCATRRCLRALPATPATELRR